MQLNAKEKLVLTEIVRNFVASAMPVSSALIAKTSRLQMSAATIRSIMGALEEKGFIDQPHTSAGRIPKTLGYRQFVNQLMKKVRVPSDEKGKISKTIQQTDADLDEVFREVSQILAQFSQQLSIIVTPKMMHGIFQRMELVPLASNKILVIITIESGMLKTIKLEIDSPISGEKMLVVSQILNERLHGMRLIDIRNRFSEIFKDIRNESSGLVKVFSQKADRLFDFGEDAEMYAMGTHNMLQQPDFSDLSALSSVVELVENRKIIVHLTDQESIASGTAVKIGEEFHDERMQECSVITACYKIGSINGTIGVIGPTRMDYSRLISLVEFTAQSITDTHGH